ncbi:hypothetical protein [Candidatus Chlamydia sanziniae]|uniref:Uncharacterized protein n=1 Tax=Candidatus Chlamydia sanziniae TaxID=1806891 RepID=A0A1A9HW64_9CHLA|nr:hypothetical protein [Candidatus Chlamydia sanziniae]ANH78661.1 hypothetical protein Cs308_0490 [Candidatus Chlamydia sanziniae]
MKYIFFSVIMVSIACGALLGAYCQLYCSIKNVLLCWEALVTHAIAKRQALITLGSFSSEENSQLIQEVDFLLKYHHVSWRMFLRKSYDILFAFKDMEDVLPQRLHDLLEISQQVNDQNDVLLCLENFWASDNLFAFETAAYEQAVGRYLQQRSRVSLCLVRWLFRFLNFPVIEFNR